MRQLSMKHSPMATYTNANAGLLAASNEFSPQDDDPKTFDQYTEKVSGRVTLIFRGDEILRRPFS